MDVLLPLIMPSLLFLLAGPLAAWLYLRWLEKGNRLGLRLFWPLAALLTLVLSLVVTYTFGDFFPGPGCFIAVTAPLAALATFLFVRFWGTSRKATLPRNGRLRTLMWFLPLLLLSVPMLSFAYARTCDALNRRAARPIIAALEAYRQEHGAYPDLASQSDLSFLVPEYLETIPPVACASPFQKETRFVSQGWSLYPCSHMEGEPLLLMVPMMGSDDQLIYNLNTRRWGIGDSFEGYCIP